jgi:hypothetical protein
MSHTVSNNSLLLLNKKKIVNNININILGMKRHMLICFYISMLVGRGKEGGTY